MYLTHGAAVELAKKRGRYPGPHRADTLALTQTVMALVVRSATDGGKHLHPQDAQIPILDRKNTIQVLQEIAFQARCALWINNGVFRIRYLPEEPAEVGTITVSGIDVELTPREDLVTKMRIKWRLSTS